MKTIAQLPPLLTRTTAHVQACQLAYAKELDSYAAREAGTSGDNASQSGYLHRIEQLYLEQFHMPYGYERYNRVVGQTNPCKWCWDELELIGMLSRYILQFAEPNPLIESGWSHGICQKHLATYRVKR
jgi:hypothetical protein